MCFLGFNPYPPQVAPAGADPDNPQITLQDGPWNIASGKGAVRQETGGLKNVPQDTVISLKGKVTVDGTWVPFIKSVAKQGRSIRLSRVIQASP